jgi:hypothetical protein
LKIRVASGELELGSFDNVSNPGTYKWQATGGFEQRYYDCRYQDKTDGDTKGPTDTPKNPVFNEMPDPGRRISHILII